MYGDRECTPLAAASAAGHESIVRLLLDTGKVNLTKISQMCGGTTPLTSAVARGHENVVGLLLKTRMVELINVVDCMGHSALIHAIKNARTVSMLSRLLEVESLDVTYEGYFPYERIKRMTALDYAVYAGEEALVPVLLGTGKFSRLHLEKTMQRFENYEISRKGTAPSLQMVKEYLEKLS